MLTPAGINAGMPRLLSDVPDTSERLYQISILDYHNLLQVNMTFTTTPDLPGAEFWLFGYG